ncbi:hypothetical protein ACTXT7_008860 [Hymenolepis weldensis]
MNIKSGYWAPLLIVLTISALTVTTGVAPKAENETISSWKSAVLFSEEMFLNCMGIFVSLASFFKLRHLKFTIASRQSVIDEFLLYIAFFFSANYLVATVALASYFNRISVNKTHKDLLMGRLALNMLELVEVILQTYLIQDCFRRCSEEEFQQRIKPGRQMIAVLLGINLAGWVVKSFQLKEADILYNITVRDEIAFGWVLIAITMPVFLFYRYHCTVCLSQAFTMLYEDETRRFEALWRQNPIYLSNLLSHTNLTMCEGGGEHFHARENLASPRLSSKQLNEMLHRKFSTQSFQQIEYMMPRRASFFNPNVTLSTSTNNLHDAEFHFGGAPFHHPSQPNDMNPVHKLSAIPYAQKKLSVPNLKRLSVSGVPKPSYRGPTTNPIGAFPSRCPLTESESYEGPNYFLSRISPVTSVTAYRNEHATQTTALFEQHHTGNSAHSHYHHQRSTTQSTLKPPSSLLKLNHNKSIDAGQLGGEQDGMQRRQTLVNLETAKYRFLAAEMAHKRVLERSVDAAGESGKKRRSKSSKKKQQKGGKVAVKGGKDKRCCQKFNMSPRDTNTNNNVPSSSPPPPPAVILNPPTVIEPPEVQISQTQQVRGFEPSKMVPLLIARNIMSTTDGEPLSAVPEEAGHDSLSLSLPIILSSVPPSPSNERSESENTFQTIKTEEIPNDNTELESAFSAVDSSTEKTTSPSTQKTNGRKIRKHVLWCIRKNATAKPKACKTPK